MSDISLIGSRYSAGVLEFYDKSSGRTIAPLGSAFGPVYAFTFTATLAEINAGKAIIPADANRKIVPVFFWVHLTGSFAALTDIRLSDDAVSPIDIATIAQAQATNGATFTPTAVSGLTLGAGYGAGLTVGKGVQIRKTGSSGTTATSAEGLIIVSYI